MNENYEKYLVIKEQCLLEASYRLTSDWTEKDKPLICTNLRE